MIDFSKLNVVKIDPNDPYLLKLIEETKMEIEETEKLKC